MIIDTSAMVAILYGEPEAAAFTRLIHDAATSRISVANYVELSIVIEKQLGPEGMRQAYALARDLDEPLLFKGKDFAETDIRSAA